MNNEKFTSQFTKYEFPKLGYIKIPGFRIPDVDIKRLQLPQNVDNETYLKELSLQGLRQKIEQKKIPLDREKEYAERLQFELNEIKNLQFTNYILLIYRIILFCRENDILNGFARGSCGGSLVMYLIGCIKIDPVKHDLLFERFISAARAETKEIDGEAYIKSGSLPDVDIDSMASKKHLINDFMEQEFPGRTAPICNLVTLQSKALIKDVLKIVGEWEEEDTKKISNLIENKFGNIETINEALRDNLLFRSWAEDKDHMKYIKVAQQLHGLIKNKSIHAAGILITNDPISDVIPLELSKKKERICGYSMKDAENFGIKIDNLGLKNLNIIDQVLKDTKLELEDIDVNDESIYEFLNNSNCYYGVFQSSDGLGKGTLQKLEPKNIDDICASIALGRPGSMKHIDTFVKNQLDTSYLEGLDDRVKPILQSTNGILIYQEQLQKLCQVMANFTPQESNQVRKAVGKKNKELMKSYKDLFINGALKNKYDEEFVNDTWQTFEDSADYQFNKCIFGSETVVKENVGDIKLMDIQPGDRILAFNQKNQSDHFVAVKNVYKNKKQLLKLDLSHNKSIRCSIDHKLLCILNGIIKMIPLSKIITYWTIGGNEIEIVCKKFKLEKIIKISSWGKQKRGTIDLEVDHPDHNFYCNDIVVSNSHSMGYGHLTAVTAYLKTNYPQHFFCACLKNAKNEQKPIEEITTIYEELHYFDIKLLPPHIIKSDIDFTIEGEDIRFGLSNIKGISESSIEKLKQFDTKDLNKFQIFGAANDCHIPLNVLSSLILVGSLDDMLTGSRSKCFLEACLWSLLTKKEKLYTLKYGEKFDYDLIETVRQLHATLKDDKGKQIIKDSRRETLKKKFEPYKELYHFNKKNEDFAKWYFEKELLGFSYSCQLIDIWKPHAPDLIPLLNMQSLLENQKMETVAYVTEVRRAKSRKGTPYLKVDISDQTGSASCWVFTNIRNDNIQKVKDANGRLPQEGDIVLVRGIKKSNDSIFADVLTIHDHKVFAKISQLSNFQKDQRISIKNKK